MIRTKANKKTAFSAGRIGTLGVLALTLSLSAYAQEGVVSPLERALEGLSTALENEQGLNADTKQALKDLVKALQDERATTPETTKQEVETVVESYLDEREASREKSRWESIGERLDVFGDFRLRYEGDFNLDSRPDRSRARIRFRAGGTYDLLDTVEFGARVITGNSDDPNSPHQTLGRVFNSFEVSLDRVYITYRPDWLEGAWATAGKFGHPFYTNPVYSELVWDADVQPEGLVLGYTTGDHGPLESLTIVAGEYIVLEQGADDEAYATVAQISGRLRLGDTLKLDAALGYYHYSDGTPDDTLVILSRDNAGNAVIDRNLDGVIDDFVSDFGILNLIAALTYDGWKYPLTLSGEYIKNVRAHGDEDQGWALGVALGNSKKKRDWKLYYQWQVVERDSIFSAVAQDDFLFATNHRSHVFGLKYQLTDQMQAHLWSLVSRRDRTFHILTGNSDRDQWRVRTDLNIKF